METAGTSRATLRGKARGAFALVPTSASRPAAPRHGLEGAKKSKASPPCWSANVSTGSTTCSRARAAGPRLRCQATTCLITHRQQAPEGIGWQSGALTPTGGGLEPNAASSPPTATNGPKPAVEPRKKEAEGMGFEPTIPFGTSDSIRPLAMCSARKLSVHERCTQGCTQPFRRR